MGWGHKLHVWGRRAAWSLSGVFQSLQKEQMMICWDMQPFFPAPPLPATPPQKKGKRIP